jgi:hypothetical protein
MRTTPTDAARPELPATTPSPTRARTRRRTSLALVLAVAGALTACTGAPPAPDPTADATRDRAEDVTASVEQVDADGADREACDLLPADALTQALGEPTEATAIPSDGWIHGQCTWNGPATGFILSVGTGDTIEAFDDPAEPDAEAKLAAYTERSRGSEGWQEVADLGDGAVVGATGMAARVGDTYLEVENLTLTAEQLVAVMRLAVAGVSDA